MQNKTISNIQNDLFFLIQSLFKTRFSKIDYKL